MAKLSSSPEPALAGVTAGVEVTAPQAAVLHIKEPGSALTHFIGIIAAVTAAPFLIQHYTQDGADNLSVFSIIVFLLSMVLLYSASTAYHTFLFHDAEKNKRFRKTDHMMIFILIAGTYTPLCLTVLRSTSGLPLLAAVWALTILGMMFKYFWVTCPKWVSSAIYLFMGWLCVFAFPDLWAAMPRIAFYELLAGGIIYTVGAVIYAMKFKRLNEISPYFGSHEIFHLFVLGGNVMQFLAVYHLV